MRSFISEERGLSVPAFVCAYLYLFLFMSGLLGPKRCGWGGGRHSHNHYCHPEEQNNRSELSFNLLPDFCSFKAY